jgi:V/A-type H+-transporting ATPase subunit C
MKRHSALEYAYAIGRVRALENFLVGRTAFREAAGAADLASALRTLGEAGRFSEDFPDIRTPAQLDRAIEKEETKLLSFLSEVLLDKPILDVFLRDSDPQEALGLGRELASAFITDHLRRKIDLGNIKIFLRVRHLELPEERLRAAVLRGGFLEERIFLDHFGLPFSDLGARLASTPYAGLWESSVRALTERETFIDLERGSEDFLMVHLRRARYIVFGPEPVYAYGLAKKRELLLVRLVVSGRIHEIPAAVLRDRISETYV